MHSVVQALAEAEGILGGGGAAPPHHRRSNQGPAGAGSGGNTSHSGNTAGHAVRRSTNRGRKRNKREWDGDERGWGRVEVATQ